MITKYAFATRVGFIPNNPGKVNQDSYILVPSAEGPGCTFKHFFGVCDGHGQNGHHASKYIKDHLPGLLKKGLLDLHTKYSQKDRLTPSDYEEIFEAAFLACDEGLGK